MTIDTHSRLDHDNEPPEDELNDLVEKLVDQLEEPLLAEDTSSLLTPLTIKKAYPGIYAGIIKILPKKPVGERQERDWDFFYKALDAQSHELAKRWVTPERKRELALDRQAAQIVAVLRQRRWSQPLSPEVVHDIYGNYQHLSRLLPFSGEQGKERDWSSIVRRLEEFAPLWVDRQTKKKQSLAVVVQRFADWLSTRPLAVISPRLLRTENLELYYQLAQFVRPGEKTDWEVIINHPLFPAEWRARWQSKRSGKFIRADITLIQAALAREQPTVFGPAWLEEHLGRALHQRIRRRLPRRHGAYDWREFVKALDAGEPPDKQWGRHWQTAKTGRKALREVEAVLEEYRDNLRAVLVESQNPEDIKNRDTIVHEFVNLAQQGNEEAQRTLRDLLKNLLAGWLKNEPKFFYYTGDEDNNALEKIFAHCVATFRQEKNESFINYLHQQLRLTAQVGHGRSGTSF